MRVPTAIFTTLAFASAGCLSTTHYIPKGELTSLASQDPDNRGSRVRVVQGFSGSEEPPEDYNNHSSTYVYVEGGHHHHHHGGGGGGGSSSGPRPSGAAKANVDDARVFLIAAAALTVGLAFTAGARYDGWVALGPDHPIHLVGPRGEYAWVPLRDLDPAAAAWARKAYVRPEDGQHWRQLERAPLDRRGLTWGMLLGSAEIAGANGVEPGFFSHVQLGGFMTNEVGLVADLGIGWRDAETDETVYELRFAGELQVFPLKAGKLHAGGFGQLGFANRSDDGAGRDSGSTLAGAGALLQIDLTTHLALTGRAGMTWAFGENASDIGVGLTIY